MRKRVLILLVCLGIIALVACGGNEGTTNTEPTAAVADNSATDTVDNAEAGSGDDSTASTSDDSADDVEETPMPEDDGASNVEDDADASDADASDDDASDDDAADEATDDDAMDDGSTPEEPVDDSEDTSDDDPADDGGDDVGDDSLVGDAARGEELYNSQTIGASGTALGCAVCHSIAEGTVVVGPSHFGLAAVAENRVAGMSAIDYLRESILNPNAFVVEGFAPDVMYQKYAEELTEQDIADLVAYLLTLQ